MDELLIKIENDIRLYKLLLEAYESGGDTYMAILHEGMINEAELLREYILSMK